MSCTAPARQTPTTSQIRPGRYPNWIARTGPMSGPAPEIAAKWWPKRTHLLVGWKFWPSLSVCAGVARESSSVATRAARKAL